jgi:hypothetical protein
MAEGDQARPDRAQERAASRGSQSSPDSAPEEVRYTADDLAESAPQLLGVSRHALAGALYGSKKKTYTLDEAKSLVNKFLKREVQTGEAEA